MPVQVAVTSDQSAGRSSPVRSGPLDVPGGTGRGRGPVGERVGGRPGQHGQDRGPAPEDDVDVGVERLDRAWPRGWGWWGPRSASGPGRCRWTVAGTRRGSARRRGWCSPRRRTARRCPGPTLARMAARAVEVKVGVTYELPNPELTGTGPASAPITAREVPPAGRGRTWDRSWSRTAERSAVSRATRPRRQGVHRGGGGALVVPPDQSGGEHRGEDPGDGGVDVGHRQDALLHRPGQPADAGRLDQVGPGGQGGHRVVHRPEVGADEAGEPPGWPAAGPSAGSWHWKTPLSWG